MKGFFFRVFFFVILMAAFLMNSVSGQIKQKFTGDVLIDGKRAAGSDFVIYYGQEKIYGSKIKDDSFVNGFEFKVDIDASYILQISSDGYLSPKYDLVVPDDLPSGVSEFSIGKIILLKEYNQLDNSVYDKPIARIIYNPESRSFIFDKEYAEKVNSKLALLKEQIRKLESGEIKVESDSYDDLIIRADELLAQNKLKQAKEYYDKALSLRKNEKYPESQIKKIDNLLSESVNESDVALQNQDINTELNQKEYDGLYDKLKNAEKKKDLNKQADLLKSLGEKYYRDAKLDSANAVLKRAKKLCEESNNNKGLAEVHQDLADVSFDMGNYESSLDNYEEAAKIRLQEDDKKGAIASLTDLAILASDLSRYDKALENFNEALVLSMEVKDKSTQTGLLNNIGNLYFEKGDFESALGYFKQSLDLDKELGKKENIAASLSNIGVAYHSQGDFDNAIKSYEESAALNEELGDKESLSMNLNNIGNVNYDWKRYEIALEYYKKSLKLKEEIDYKKGIANSFYNIGNVYMALGDYSQAIGYFEKSNLIAEELGLNEITARNYESLSKAHYELQDCQKAFDLFKKYSENTLGYSDEKMSVQVLERKEVKYRFDDKRSDMIADLRSEIEKQKLIARFQAQGKQMEVELQKRELAEEELKSTNQRRVIYFLGGGLSLIFLFLLLMLRENKHKKNANELLAGQRDMIEIQNQEITDSIMYAKRIQSAILPGKEMFDTVIPDSFVFYRPRNIVSGDFYWLAKVENKSIIAVADCTGHGVPGAFMSMLGMAFLKEIVIKEYITHTGIILKRLRKEIVKSLDQKGESGDSKDGMDIAICSLDYDEGMLQFSGANNDLYIVRNGELIVVKGDKMPIGFHYKMEKFGNEDIKLEKGDSCYLYSDGYADQFGGADGKKFKYLPFRDLIVSMATQPMDKQNEKLEKEFDKWKGSYDQIDDVTVLGFRY